jgi:hypothetical protein
MGKLAKMSAKLDALAEGAKAAKKTEMFIGPRSDLWDEGTHALALKMEDEGASPRTIWEQTMNWRTPEGRWAQEISDKEAEYNPESMLANAKTKYKSDVAKFEEWRKPYEDAWGLKNLYERLKKQTPHDQFYLTDDYGNMITDKFTGQPRMKEGATDLMYDLHQDLKKQAVAQFAEQSGAPVSERAEHLFRNSPLWHVMERAQMKPSAEGIIRPSAMTVRNLPMSETIEHPELFKAYPRFENYPFSLMVRGKMGGADASFNPGTYDVKLSASSLTPESSLLHELQHAVQEREGWEGGANVRQFSGFTPRTAKQLYLRNLGEGMARATEQRQNLSMAQRNAIFPADSFSLPNIPKEETMDQFMWQGMDPNKKSLIMKYLRDNIEQISPVRRYLGLPSSSESVPLAYDPKKVEDIANSLKDEIEGPVQKFGIGGAVKSAVKAAMKGASTIEQDLAEMEDLAKLETPLKKSTNIIKEKGGNWLGGSDRSWGITTPEDVATILRHAGNPEPLNNWVDKKLVRYIKNDLGTAEDEVRKLFDQGISHIPEIQAEHRPTVKSVRQWAGMPEENLATTPLGRRWEDVADMNIYPLAAQKWLDPKTDYEKTLTNVMLEANPWIAKVPPETPVHQLSSDLEGRRGQDPLGFRHLVDELRNATIEDSNLPEHLRLDPAKLDKVTVPQAVQLVDKINKWRAENMSDANAALANNPATILHKDYPEEGFRWVQLKTPPDPKVRLANPNALRDALRYEGDVMGHCVGGYCPAVEKGESQIFSLRDKKGQPHVTIEVAPDDLSPEEYYDSGEMSDELKDWLDEEYRYGGKGGDTWKDKIMEAQEYQDFNAGISPKIVQIKGKANEPPIDKYIPFVQDFVRARDWSSVDDLENARLATLEDHDYGDAGMSIMQLSQRLEEAKHYPEQQYFTEQELRDLMDKYGVKHNFAKGGAVSNPKRLAAVAASCGCNKAEGGLVAQPTSIGYDPERVQSIADQLRQEIYA